MANQRLGVPAQGVERIAEDSRGQDVELAVLQVRATPMKTTSLLTFTLASLIGAAGCIDAADDGKSPDSDVKGGAEGKAEAWGSADDPKLFSGSLEYKLDALPMQGQATNTPWAGNYWPVYEDSINHKWAGASSDAPSIHTS